MGGKEAAPGFGSFGRHNPSSGKMGLRDVEREKLWSTLSPMSLGQRIHRDAQRVAGDPEVSALLGCLIEHLFDPRLDTTTFLAKVCGASRQVRDRLAAAVGPLKGYVTELRMAEAARLVRETELGDAPAALLWRRGQGQGRGIGGPLLEMLLCSHVRRV